MQRLISAVHKLRDMAEAGGEPPKFDDATCKRLKREALQLVIQLPDDREEAIAVLELAYGILTGFVNSPSSEIPPPPWRPRRRV